jgi:hypothetical protein
MPEKRVLHPPMNTKEVDNCTLFPVVPMVVPATNTRTGVIPVHSMPQKQVLHPPMNTKEVDNRIFFSVVPMVAAATNTPSRGYPCTSAFIGGSPEVAKA